MKNILGTKLAACSHSPLTGFTRNGCCETGPMDHGTHTVCAIVTEDFLSFTKSRGNDLTRPMPHYQFPGLVAGDRWCLCVSRWLEAYRAGCAPLIVPEATHENTLKYVPLETLEIYFVDKLN